MTVIRMVANGTFPDWNPASTAPRPRATGERIISPSNSASHPDKAHISGH